MPSITNIYDEKIDIWSVGIIMMELFRLDVNHKNTSDDEQLLFIFQVSWVHNVLRRSARLDLLT